MKLERRSQWEAAALAFLIGQFATAATAKAGVVEFDWVKYWKHAENEIHANPALREAATNPDSIGFANLFRDAARSMKGELVVVITKEPELSNKNEHKRGTYEFAGAQRKPRIRVKHFWEKAALQLRNSVTAALANEALKTKCSAGDIDVCKRTIHDFRTAIAESQPSVEMQRVFLPNLVDLATLVSRENRDWFFGSLFNVDIQVERGVLLRSARGELSRAFRPDKPADSRVILADLVRSLKQVEGRGPHVQTFVDVLGLILAESPENYLKADITFLYLTSFAGDYTKAYEPIYRRHYKRVGRLKRQLFCEDLSGIARGLGKFHASKEMDAVLRGLAENEIMLQNILDARHGWANEPWEALEALERAQAHGQLADVKKEIANAIRLLNVTGEKCKRGDAV